MPLLVVLLLNPNGRPLLLLGCEGHDVIHREHVGDKGAIVDPE